jgi:hypothetical protein
MLQRLRGLSQHEAKASSLKGLMEVVVSGERPAAPQPPGLAVTLHPYQRQSLQVRRCFYVSACVFDTWSPART